MENFNFILRSRIIKAMFSHQDKHFENLGCTDLDKNEQIEYRIWNHSTVSLYEVE